MEKELLEKNSKFKQIERIAAYGVSALILFLVALPNAIIVKNVLLPVFASSIIYGADSVGIMAFQYLHSEEGLFWVSLLFYVSIGLCTIIALFFIKNYFKKMITTQRFWAGFWILTILLMLSLQTMLPQTYIIRKPLFSVLCENLYYILLGVVFICVFFLVQGSPAKRVIYATGTVILFYFIAPLLSSFFLIFVIHPLEGLLIRWGWAFWNLFSLGFLGRQISFPWYNWVEWGVVVCLWLFFARRYRKLIGLFVVGPLSHPSVIVTAFTVELLSSPDPLKGITLLAAFSLSLFFLAVIYFYALLHWAAEWEAQFEVHTLFPLILACFPNWVALLFLFIALSYSILKYFWERREVIRVFWRKRVRKSVNSF